MGYLTEYNLKIKGVDTSEVVKHLREHSEHAFYAIDENGDYASETKWYEHENEMKEFSSQYPNAIFKLSGEGEQNGDIWKKYFKDGKMQIARAIIIFEDYDESKLS